MSNRKFVLWSFLSVFAFAAVSASLIPKGSAQEEVEDELAPLVPIPPRRVKGMSATQSTLRFEKSGTLVLPLPHQVLVNGAVRLESRSSISNLKENEVRCNVGFQREMRLEGGKEKLAFTQPMEIQVHGEEVRLDEPRISSERLKSKSGASMEMLIVVFPIQDPWIKSISCAKYGRAPQEFALDDLMRGMFGKKTPVFQIVESNRAPAEPETEVSEPSDAGMAQ